MSHEMSGDIIHSRTLIQLFPRYLDNMAKKHQAAQKEREDRLARIHFDCRIPRENVECDYNAGERVYQLPTSSAEVVSVQFVPLPLDVEGYAKPHDCYPRAARISVRLDGKKRNNVIMYDRAEEFWGLASEIAGGISASLDAIVGEKVIAHIDESRLIALSAAENTRTYAETVARFAR